MITTVLFDLDGTLLPFDQQDFVKIYFSELCKKLAPLGYEADYTVKSVWAGTAAMIKNDGSRLNADAFWETFRAMNAGRPDARPLCDEFYTQEFDRARTCLKYVPQHGEMLRELRSAGLKPVLATNPIFPLDGVKTRLAWAGLSAEDFDYITHYENSTYCKPNPMYFEEIMAKLGLKPDECLMVGNNVSEDMAAEKCGIRTFLVTDFVENPDGCDYSRFKQGNAADAAEYALSLRG